MKRRVRDSCGECGLWGEPQANYLHYGRIICQVGRIICLNGRITCQVGRIMYHMGRIISSKDKYRYLKKKDKPALMEFVYTLTTASCSRQSVLFLSCRCKSSSFFSMISSLVFLRFMDRKKDMAPTMIKMKKARKNN